MPHLIPMHRPGRGAAPVRLPWPGVLPAGLLLIGLALTGCGAGAPQGADENEQRIDYRARHEVMLDNVLVRPGQLEAQRLERERRARQRSRVDWEAVMARQQAFVQAQERRQQGGREEFQRILERQREYNDARRQARTDAWAQFIERNAPPAPAEGSGDASAAGQP